MNSQFPLNYNSIDFYSKLKAETGSLNNVLFVYPFDIGLCCCNSNLSKKVKYVYTV